MPPKIRLAIDNMEIKGSFKPSATREGYYWPNEHGDPKPARKYDHYRLSDLKRAAMTPTIIITNCGHYLEYAHLAVLG